MAPAPRTTGTGRSTVLLPPWLGPRRNHRKTTTMTKTLVTLAAFSFATLASSAYADPSFSPRFTASTEVVNVSDSTWHRPSFDTIVRNWDEYGFLPPSKPAQARVNGRGGVSISGSEYAAAVAILRSGGAIREGRSASVGARTPRRCAIRRLSPRLRAGRKRDLSPGPARRPMCMESPRTNNTCARR